MLTSPLSILARFGLTNAREGCHKIKTPLGLKVKFGDIYINGDGNQICLDMRGAQQAHHAIMAPQIGAESNGQDNGFWHNIFSRNEDVAAHSPKAIEGEKLNAHDTGIRAIESAGIEKESAASPLASLLSGLRTSGVPTGIAGGGLPQDMKASSTLASSWLNTPISVTPMALIKALALCSSGAVLHEANAAVPALTASTGVVGNIWDTVSQTAAGAVNGLLDNPVATVETVSKGAAGFTGIIGHFLNGASHTADELTAGQLPDVDMALAAAA